MIRTKNVISSAILLLIGIGFLAATTVRVMNTHDFIDRAKTADGVVIVTKHAKRHPRIEYTNAAGEKRWFLANEWITGFRFVSYKMGQHVRVLYDPADPAAFSVDDFLSLYIVSVSGGIISIIIIVLGLCVLVGKMTIQTKDMVITVGHFLIGIFFIIITFICTESTRKFIGKAKVTEGVVIKTTYGGSHPDVAYTTASGENRRFPANGLIFGYKLGDRVRVLYDPANLAHPNIDDFGALYAGSIGYGLFGICFIYVGVMSIFGLVKIKFGRY